MYSCTLNPGFIAPHPGPHPGPNPGPNPGSAPQVRQLHDNANYVRKRLLEMGLHVLGDWNSPVMPIMIYHSGKLPVFSRMCLDNHVAMVG
jgi:hypothetical protein